MVAMARNGTCGGGNAVLGRRWREFVDVGFVGRHDALGWWRTLVQRSEIVHEAIGRDNVRRSYKSRFNKFETRHLIDVPM